MSSGEWENGLAVIEQRRPPFVAVVASGAIVHARAKLISMRVFVAFGALCWSACELHMHQRQLHVWRLVAVSASHRTMTAEQWETCLRMVEFRQVFPVFC